MNMIPTDAGYRTDAKHHASRTPRERYNSALDRILSYVDEGTKPFLSAEEFVRYAEQSDFPSDGSVTQTVQRLLRTDPAVRMRIRAMLGLPRSPTYLPIPPNMYYVGLDASSNARPPSALHNAKETATREATQFLLRAEEYIKLCRLPSPDDFSESPTFPHPEALSIALGYGLAICPMFRTNNKFEEQKAALRGWVFRQLTPKMTRTQVRYLCDKHDESVLHGTNPDIEI